MLQALRVKILINVKIAFCKSAFLGVSLVW